MNDFHSATSLANIIATAIVTVIVPIVTNAPRLAINVDIANAVAEPALNTNIEALNAPNAYPQSLAILGSLSFNTSLNSSMRHSFQI